ncbi:hypothetical protein [Nonomuraea sp. 10N515B]|uniref:hypothetical protein n=1 Tax=Nonomuraea sp. 10N515B TaxID=3457422 RepID=UPI003FCD4079
MFKRLLLAVALTASTLVISGTATGAAQASDASRCAPAQQVTQASGTARRCEWRGKCYWCYRNGRWERQYCKGGSN